MNVYDFDGTVFRGDSTFRFYLFALGRERRALRGLPSVVRAFFLLGIGKTDKTRAKEELFRSFLPLLDDPEALVARFWERDFGRVESWYLHTKKPDDVIASASPEFLLRPVCKRLGISRLVASRVDMRSGLYSGKNCDGAEKLRRFTAEIGEAPEAFYSDSLSDAPLAGRARRAFLVKKGKISPWPGRK